MYIVLFTVEAKINTNTSTTNINTTNTNVTNKMVVAKSYWVITYYQAFCWMIYMDYLIILIKTLKDR